MSGNIGIDMENKPSSEYGSISSVSSGNVNGEDAYPVADQDLSNTAPEATNRNPRLRRFSSSRLSTQSEKMLNNLLEKLETVSTALPGPEAMSVFRRKWVPLQVSSTNKWKQKWLDYMHNPLLPPVTVLLK